MNAPRLMTCFLFACLLLLLTDPAAARPPVRNCWRFAEGYFIKTEGDKWEGRDEGGTAYYYVEKETVDEYVVLFDASRNLTLRLYDDREEYSSGNGPFRRIRGGAWGDKPPAAAAPAPPPVFNLCKDQTAIRDQGDRDTCPFFPPVAAMEAAYKRAGVNVDLSAEHLGWIRNVTGENDNVAPGAAEDTMSTGGGGGASGVLTTYAICPAQDMPYHPEEAYGNHISDVFKGYGVAHYDWSKPFSQFVLNRWNLNPQLLSSKVRADSRYGVDKIVKLTGAELREPAQFEAILAAGHEIIFTYTIHRCPDPPKGQPAVLRHFDPAGENIGGHFNLVVGYDRPRHFFVVKDSGGPIHYSAKDLSKEWKDVAKKYDGFNLMDYSWLAACNGAYFITKIAPAGSPRFTAQRALGQWEVAFKRDDKEVMTGTLCWRRLPNPAEAGKPDLRIGDLFTRDGKQYRVNATLQGDGIKQYELKLYIDFGSQSVPQGSTDGSIWKGKVKLPKKGSGSCELVGDASSPPTPWGPMAGMKLAAEQIADKNLLKSMSVPKFSP